MVTNVLICSGSVFRGISTIIAFLIFFCAFPSSPLSASDKVVLQLRWDHQFQFAGYYAAKWQGFYEEVGIDVEIKSAVTPGKILSAVKEVGEGRAHFGIGGADVLKGVDDGHHLVLVASIFQHSAAAFYTRAETAIYSPADFLKLKVARRVDDLIDIELQAMLKAEGIDPAEVKPYPHKPGIDHLMSGEVDVMPGYSINIPFTASTKAFPIKEFRPIKYGIDFYGDSIFTAARLVRDNSDLVTRFKAARLKGWQYALDNPDELVTAISEKLVRARPVENTLKFNSYQSEGIVHLIPYPEVEIGHVNPDRWAKMHDYLSVLGLVTQPLSLDEFIYDPDRMRQIKEEHRQWLLRWVLVIICFTLVVAIIWLYVLRKTVATRTQELRLLNEQLLESEGKYRNLIEIAQEGIWVIDKDSNTQFVNPGMAQMLGYTAEEMQDKSLFSFMDDKGIILAEENIERRKKGIAENHDFEFLKKDGSRIYVTMVTAPILDGEGEYDGAIAGIIDITQRIETERVLQESERRFDLAMQFTNDGLYDWDLITDDIYFSPGWKKMLGYEPDELDNAFSIWEELTHPAGVEAAHKMLQEVIEGERERFELEFKMKHKNGSWVDIFSRANVVFDGDQKAIRVVGTHLDMTERKKYENELKVMTSAIDNSLNGFDIVNADGLFVYVNKAYVEMWGYDSADEIIGTSPADHCVDPHMPDIIISELQKRGEYEFELEAKRKDGSTFDVHMYARLAQDEHGNNIFPTTCIDISERKKAQREKELLERQLHQAQKMESIGNLAGGIAHDFNNILASVLGFTELAIEDAAKDSEQMGHLQEVYAAGMRATELVKRILAFARQSDETPQPVKPGIIVKEVLKLLRPSLPTSIEIEHDIESNSTIKANATQLHQVVLNLCTNASHAMQEKGDTLRLSLKDVTLDKRCSWTDLGLSYGEYVELSVTDNGEGISPGIIDSIFDPYFTTKNVGEGTGMGLAMVKGIVETYGGKIQVRSELTVGTTFTILFPTTGDSNLVETYTAGTSPHGDEHILFVDDEPPLARLGSRILESLGYRVSSRSSSFEALELFKEKPADFDLVITDMTMPHMTGDELAYEIKRVRSDIPVVVCTGYSSKMSEEQAAQMGIDAFTYKPLSKVDLAAIVRDVLNGSTDTK